MQDKRYKRGKTGRSTDCGGRQRGYFLLLPPAGERESGWSFSF
ncbi:hypothetical protein GCWU000341_01752 [Oribacterium sp. oral taxon 078 str. F0262]|nr:hypothetical protein GCWU000341_01752 [Oribacterium sp. oral taxon 078 str. F0262]